MVRNILLCTLGTLGFCAVLNAPKSRILTIAIGATISGGIFEILTNYTELNLFLCTLIATIGVEVYSEIMARIRRTPAIVILIPSTIPLLPGGDLYFSMRMLVDGNKEHFFIYAKSTVLVAFAIAMGAVVMLMSLNTIRRIKEYIQSRRNMIK